MEGTIAKELYPESLQSTQLDSVPTLGSDYKQNRKGSDVDDLSRDSASLWGCSDEEADVTSDLDREWQRRHDQFHTIGYRDGLIAGKEASSQVGFNVGFRQSVSAGFNWGVVRGVSSVLASLPDDLKDKLMGTEDNRNKFQSMYESVHALSTEDALMLFNDDITAEGAVDECADANSSNQGVGSSKQNSDHGKLGKHYRELQALLLESPALNVHLQENPRFSHN